MTVVVKRAPARRPEEMSLLFDVWLLMHLVSGMLDGALEGSGLTGDDFGLYSLLRVFGPATPTQIARWTGMRATTVSAALRRMAVRGHSDTTPNPADRRSYLVVLSPDGAKAHLAAAGPFLTELARLGDVVSPDEHTLRLQLQRLDTAMRATTGLDPRPYALPESTAADRSGARWVLPYHGDQLTAEQEAAARSYLDFLRERARPARSARLGPSSGGR
jgi:DNA-binding MarR family transcriptional regulator